jgi:hypothetical protein
VCYAHRACLFDPKIIIEKKLPDPQSACPKGSFNGRIIIVMPSFVS